MNELNAFKQEMDGWVKELNAAVSHYHGIPDILDESIQNIDHNYELIHEMGKEIQELKEEVAALKILQIMHLRELKKVHMH